MTEPGSANGRPFHIVPRSEEEPPLESDVRSLLHVGDHVELANILLSRLNLEAVTVWAVGAWWQYEPPRGVWGEIRRETIDQMTTEYSGAKVNGEKKPMKIKASDVNGARKVAEVLAASPEHFDEALPGIAFTNGFAMVSADGVKLAGHSAAHRARWAYPFAFEPRETCAFRDFLANCFEGDEDAEQKIQILREFIGACIVGKGTLFQLCLVLLGDGSNGKGVTMTSIEACMPEGSVSAVPPQKMGDVYFLARLAGKLLNVVSELPESDIIAADAFKAVISGDSIEARKIYCEPFTHRPLAGHIYACNRLPGTTDQSDGFWRRFVVLKYGRKFTVDAGFSATVTGDVAATVGWALAGVPALLARGKYETPASSEQMKREWKLSSNQVAVFFEENLEASDVEWVSAAEVYRTYKSWATDNGHRPMASNTFGQRMALLGFPSRKTEKANVYDVKKKAGVAFRDDAPPWRL